MADITEIVKIKSVEKNTPKMQLMDRSRTDSFTKDTYDNAGGTLQPPSMPSGNQIVAPPGRKKTSSFQITSVTQSRLSHDGGEDSADDLDESHTEDLSSELIDCSKTTDIDNDGASSEDFSASTGVNNIDDPSNNILITGVNVSQVDPSVGVPVPVLINAALSMTSAVTTAVSADIPVAAPGVSPVVASVTELVETSDPQQQWENRFKVVKIVNSEPFNRGRWIVMDYTDPTIPTSVQPSEAKPEPPIEGVGSGNSSAGSSVHIVPGENHLPENPLVPGESIQATVTQQTTFINQPQMNTNQQQSEYSAASLNSSNAQNIGTVNSNLPSTANPLASVQQVSHSVISHVPSTDPPTVIVQEATIVPIPTEQNNVPQADKIKISKVVNKEQIPLFDNQNQDSPVLKPLLDSLPDTLGVPLKSDETTDGDDAESASGSSTVAIDNKIEQAMDLVKSHLMFAVREEVDVLKEKISELVDKISQLEFENGILKASASQETLNKLSQQQPPSNTKSLNTQQSSAPQQQTGSVA